MKKAIIAVIIAAVAASDAWAQANPDWRAITWAFDAAWDIKDRIPGFYLTRVDETDTTVAYVATAGAASALITFGKHHYSGLDWTAEQFAHAWALQPEKLRRTVMPLHLRIHDDANHPPLYNYFTNPDNAGGPVPPSHEIAFPPGQWQFDDRAHWHFRDLKVNLGFEELMTHELCHGVDYEAQARFGTLLSASAEWKAAADADGQYVTDYARRNGAIEDFAESCGVYILMRWGHWSTDRINTAHTARVRATMPNRWEYLALLFDNWTDTISFDAVGPTKVAPAKPVAPTIAERPDLTVAH